MNKSIKTIGATVIGLAVAGAVVYAAGVEYDLNRPARMESAMAPEGTVEAQIARGKYVAFAADCAACHTSKGGGAPFAGGYSLETPFGTILSSNITSDKETGIGNWSLEQFDRAVRHGKGSHGYLYPAMPYTAYASMSDGDIRDLWAYVKTIAPVSHPVVENQLPFPYNQRWLLGGWNALFFHAQPFKADDTKSVEYNRGAYLVEGAGHCAACHTGKNFLGGDSSAFLQGGSLSGWYAPDLTPNPHVGLGTWSIDDIVGYLQTGSNEKTVSSGPMTEAIENSTQHLNPSDLRAIAVFLKGQKPSPSVPPSTLSADDESMQLGKRVFESQCIACHASNGTGVRRMIPALAGNAAVNSNDPASLLQVVLKGEEAPMTAGNPTAAGMPRFDWKLSDDEIASVLTYVRNSWGNGAPAVSAKSVATVRASEGAKAWLGK
ncbi:c-type cytochrome [Paraburkholderia sp. BCC1886]|uniref:c-type cytochrome n=1 Tax=Paraburkholderia sp. BCC1886 TaxID=2562670 RepID=UPI00118216A2|nr:c-type cytochrome [Paraburkholderia sp. BCC1886]